MQLTPEESEALRKALPHGAMSAVAKKLGMTRGHVSNVVNALTPGSTELIQALYEKAVQSQQDRQEVTQKLVSLNTILTDKPA